MSNAIRMMLILLVVILLGGLIFLMTWDIPAPVQHIERVIPDERFPR